MTFLISWLVYLCADWFVIDPVLDGMFYDAIFMLDL